VLKILGNANVVAARAGWYLAVLCAVAMAGCASAPRGGGSDPEVVGERAQARWNALLADDVDKAYGFISPAGRSLVSRDAYEKSIRRGFWNSARVSKVECRNADACDVEAIIEYTALGRKFSSGLQEKWVKQDSSWWYLWER
jgi:hypothetical protein